MDKTSDVRIPWPGPKPYDERDWQEFAGRGDEIHKLVDKINFQKLTVLAGGSGTGKTSLVRAGIIPILRLERYHEQGNHRQWPVLLLRRWGAEGSASIGDLLRSQVDDAIEAIEDWGRWQDHERALRDAQHLREIQAKESVDGNVDSVIALLEAMSQDQALREREKKDQSEAGGLVVVFDQFEELLRAGGLAASEALRVVRNLYRSSSPLRMLISMRQEYLYTLKELEKTIGGLSGRSVFLRPLREKTVLAVVREVSEKSQIPIESDVAEQVVEWLRRSSLGGTVETLSRLQVAESEETEQEIRRPDLLRLQAILRELSHFAVKNSFTSVSGEVLEKFSRSYAGEPRKVVGGALERWIEAAVQQKASPSMEPSTDDEESSLGSYADAADMSTEELEKQVRRIAIRIGPNLSSLDYKVPQEENVLFQAALGEDIWRLGLKDPALRDQVRIVEGGDGSKLPKLDVEALRLPGELRDVDRNNLSGVAKKKGWSPAKTGNQLVLCFRETLHRLARANILTPTVKKQGGAKTTIWELVHDQFGPSFTSWSREHRDTWEDCLNALVISNGIQPIAVPAAEIRPQPDEQRLELDHISWQGCSVEPVKTPRLAFYNTWFVDCFLVGTIFEKCDFYGGGFKNCALDGALFRNCKFLKCDGSTPRFERCDSSSLAIISSYIERLEYRDCQLRQPTIDRTKLDEQVLFSGDSRIVQGYINPEPCTKHSTVDFEPGTRTFLCSASQDWFGYLRFVEGEGNSFNNALANNFWVRERD